jgi:hypothetical protein
MKTKSCKSAGYPDATRGDHQALVERWIETARRVDETFGRIEAAFMADPENEIRAAIWSMFAEYTRTLAAQLSDDAEDARGWLEWFAWECDFGRKPMEMVFADGEKLLVVGASDLLAAIQTDENGCRVWDFPANAERATPKLLEETDIDAQWNNVSAETRYEMCRDSFNIGARIAASFISGNAFYPCAGEPSCETENDTAAELAAWELLRDSRAELETLRTALKFIATDKIANAADMRYRAARALEYLPPNA